MLAKLFLSTYNIPYQVVAKPNPTLDMQNTLVLDVGQKVEGLEAIMKYAVKNRTADNDKMPTLKEDCEYALDRMAFYTRGMLKEKEQERVEKHLRTRCKTCMEDLRLSMNLQKLIEYKDKVKTIKRRGVGESDN